MNFYDTSLEDPFDIYDESTNQFLSISNLASECLNDAKQNYSNNLFSKDWRISPFENDENLYDIPSQTKELEEEIAPDGILYLDTPDKFEHDGVLYLTDDRPYVSSDSHLTPPHYDNCENLLDIPFVSADSHTEMNSFMSNLGDSGNYGENLLDRHFVSEDSHTEMNSFISNLGDSGNYESLLDNTFINLDPPHTNINFGTCAPTPSNSKISDPHTNINFRTCSPSKIADPHTLNYLTCVPSEIVDPLTNINFSTCAPFTSDSKIDKVSYRSPVSTDLTFCPNSDTWNCESKFSNLSVTDLLKVDLFSNNQQLRQNEFSNNQQLFQNEFSKNQQLRQNEFINNQQNEFSNNQQLFQNEFSNNQQLFQNEISKNQQLCPNNTNLWKSDLSFPTSTWITNDHTVFNKNPKITEDYTLFYKKPKISSLPKTGGIGGFSNRNDYFRSPLREQQLQRYRQKKLRRIYQRSVDEKRSTQAKSRGRNSRGRFVAEPNPSFLSRGIKGH